MVNTRKRIRYLIKLKSDLGLSLLIEFLDKHLAKDDLTDSLEKLDDFDEFRRKEGQSIHEYCNV